MIVVNKRQSGIRIQVLQLHKLHTDCCVCGLPSPLGWRHLPWAGPHICLPQTTRSEGGGKGALGGMCGGATSSGYALERSGVSLREEVRSPAKSQGPGGGAGITRRGEKVFLDRMLGLAEAVCVGGSFLQHCSVAVWRKWAVAWLLSWAPSWVQQVGRLGIEYVDKRERLV